MFRKNAWKVAVAAIVAGAGFTGSLFAQDNCSVGCAPPPATCAAPTQPCEVFSNEGCTVTEQLGCGESAGGGCCLDFGGAGKDEDEGCGYKIGGWVSAGYHDSVTPISDNRGDGFSFNDQPHRLNLHQGWLFVEKEADGSNGLDFGFRVDAMYGTDAAKTQAFGNPSNTWDLSNTLQHGAYGFAIPQAYLEVASGDFSVIAGHFFTLVGYEVVTAPGNFFYSHAFTMFNSEPFTHTGILGTYSASDNLEVYAGWTAGWDTAFAQNNGGSNFLGGFSASLCEQSTLTYITTFGNLGARGDGYSHSIVVATQICDSLEHVIQSDYVTTDQLVFNDQIGLNNYLFYTVSDCLKAGLRAEWWKTDSISFYEVTGGVNINVGENVVIRPEIRRDWSPGQNAQRTTFGVDAVLTF